MFTSSNIVQNRTVAGPVRLPPRGDGHGKNRTGITSKERSMSGEFRSGGSKTPVTGAKTKMRYKITHLKKRRIDRALGQV